MSIPSFDPTQYKASQRREWGVSADGWKRHWNIWEQAAQHLNERLVELAWIRPGHRVLDVATGLGEPAFTAARRVGPNGSVVATDLSPAMLSLAREEAGRLGLRNVEFREMDAEAPDLPAQSFDAALCRWTLMFLPHLITALTRLRELLVPEGRFAAAVHFNWEITGAIGRDGQPSAPSRGVNLFVVAKQGTGWRVVAGQVAIERRMP